MNRHVLPAVVVIGVALLVPAVAGGAPPGERRLSLPDAPHRYADPPLPPHFEPRWVKALDTTPADNPTTDAGATLGRVLFYDTRLSASDTVSCGTCHLQKHAFAEPRRVSVGHEGRKGDRNAMSLVNLRFSRAGFFWDERAETLEEAVGLPVRSRIEMAGRDGPATARALAADARYAPLFRAAFGTPEVTDGRIRRALAQFLRAMVSADSKYDRGAARVSSAKDDFPNFTAGRTAARPCSCSTATCATTSARGSTSPSSTCSAR
jgi:cytochrome c peroxidase